MLPTLAGQGEWVIVDKWTHHTQAWLRTPLQKGDVVTVLRPDVLDRRQTKRITAIEGDSVTYQLPHADRDKTIVVRALFPLQKCPALNK